MRITINNQPMKCESELLQYLHSYLAHRNLIVLPIEINAFTDLWSNNVNNVTSFIVYSTVNTKFMVRVNSKVANLVYCDSGYHRQFIAYQIATNQSWDTIGRRLLKCLGRDNASNAE